MIGDNLYFCIGDVSGKGVPASLFMAQATRLFRTLASQRLMPADIANRMNAELSENNDQGMFVTMFFGLVNLKSGKMEFCNAGHNPPLLIETGEFLEMEPNAPIGLWPELEYIGESIENIKDKLLFFYTDGLNEAENKQQQQFGDEHLQEIVRKINFETAKQVVDILNMEVERHRNGADPNDDITMLCLKVKS
jgi:serine phosphatase RsbU (regulator of sigma subunit)